MMFRNRSFSSKPELNGSVVSGICVPFNTLSLPIRERGRVFQEKILPGALDKTLGRVDVRALQQHDKARLLGRQGAGTLELKVTPKGLAYRLVLPKTSWGRELETSIRSGLVDECSFGYFESQESMTYPPGPYPVLELREIILAEISLVIRPYHQGTTAAIE